MQTMLTFRHAGWDDIKRLVEITREESWWYSEFEFYVLLKLDPCSLIIASDKHDIPVGT